MLFESRTSGFVYTSEIVGSFFWFEVDASFPFRCFRQVEVGWVWALNFVLKWLYFIRAMPNYFGSVLLNKISIILVSNQGKKPLFTSVFFSYKIHKRVKIIDMMVIIVMKNGHVLWMELDMLFLKLDHSWTFNYVMLMCE